MDTKKALYIGDMLGDIFGFSSPIYIPWINKSTPWQAGTSQGVRYMEEEEAEAHSYLGTTVLGTVTLMGGSYKVYDHKGALSNQNMTDFLLPYATIMDFSRSMNMTKTKVLGNEGTVKEIYGLDDWSISIRGIALDDEQRNAQKTAHEQIDELVKWRSVCDSINVSGKLFNNKDIYALCMENLDIRPKQGKYNVITFEMKCTSDKPMELLL